MNTRQRRNAVTFIVGGLMVATIMVAFTVAMIVHQGSLIP